MSEKELFPEPTVGELMEVAKAAAPGSIHVDGFIVTYVGEFNYATGPSSARWCFTCREVTDHSPIATVPVGESIDTPLTEVRCLVCGCKDADLFPGKVREDDQPE